MKQKKFAPFFKWGIYSLILFLFYILQTMPGLFSLWGVKPVLVFSLVVTVSMFEDVLPSAIFGTVAGLLWDISSDKLFGFNGLIFLLICMTVSLICIYYLRSKLLNSLMFVAAAAIFQGLIEYVFYYVLWGYADAYKILLLHILPTALYTTAVTPLVFLLVRRTASKFAATERI